MAGGLSPWEMRCGAIARWYFLLELMEKAAAAGVKKAVHPIRFRVGQQIALPRRYVQSLGNDRFPAG